jgi:predicted AlkP superfamily phosphohydrolase/phosphomutase
MALMRALMQLAGLEHVRYNDRILYEYNTRNPESHYRAFERRQLQDRQGRLLLTREPLEWVPSYLPKDRQPEPASVRGTGLLFIALDGMTPRLIHRWASEGLLPNLGKVIDTGHVRDIEVPKGFGNDAFWNSLATGRLPDEHGYYYRNFWRPDEYKLSFYDLDNELGGEPFWGELSDSDLEMAIVDMPEVKHAGRANGLEVTEWVTHARLLPPRFVPAELKDDWIGRFGTDPTHGNTETMRPRNRRQFVALMDQLLGTVEQKTRAALHYLDRGGWDLFAVAYTQGHDVGHQFWHIHDPTHPNHRRDWLQRYGDPVLQMYQSIDRSVGRLIEQAGRDAGVMIVAGVAMEAKVSCNAVLDEILWAIENAMYGPYRKEALRKDRTLRRFFAVPHNNLSGTIRLNLKGREAQGLIEPGTEYRRTLDKLEHCLRQVINRDTGEPVVDEIVRIQDAYQGTRVHALPDMFALWNRRSPIKSIRSPWFDKITLQPRSVTDTRSGDHVCEAEMITNFDPPFGKGPIPVQDIASGLIGLLI